MPWTRRKVIAQRKAWPANMDNHLILMLLPNPLCPLSGAKLAGLQATVLLLLGLLIKARIQIKAFSALGLVLLLLQTLVFLAAGGALGLGALAALAYGFKRSRATA